MIVFCPLHTRKSSCATARGLLPAVQLHSLSCPEGRGYPSWLGGYHILARSTTCPGWGVPCPSQGVPLPRPSWEVPPGLAGPRGRTWDRTLDRTSDRTRGTPRKDLGPETGVLSWKGSGTRDQVCRLPNPSELTKRKHYLPHPSYADGNNTELTFRSTVIFSTITFMS